MRPHLRSTSSRRAPVRWTVLEISLVAISLSLLILTLSIELSFWLNPPSVPAAQLTVETTSTGTSDHGMSDETNDQTQSQASYMQTGDTNPGDGPEITPDASTPNDPDATNVDENGTVMTAPADDSIAQVEATATATTPAAPAGPVVGDAPLQVQLNPSVASVPVGASLQYIITVNSGNSEQRRIDARLSIDGQMDLVSAMASNGSCLLQNPVTCSITAQRNQPATITVNVQVHNNAVPGGIIVSQVLAQDDINNTAASDQVLVVIEGAAPAPGGPVEQAPPSGTNPSTGSQPEPVEDAQVQPTATPSASGPEPAAATPTTVVSPNQSVPTSVPENTDDGVMDAPETEMQPLPTFPPAYPGPEDSTDPADGSPNLPPTAVLPTAVLPTAEIPSDSTFDPFPTVEPQPRTLQPNAPLPNTSATVPAIGLAGILFGIAMVLHGTRRVRRADRKLSEQSQLIARLSPLLEAIANLQRKTAKEIDQMTSQSDGITNLLNTKQDNQPDQNHDNMR